ncbi:non-ribosomal peptide synthetase, partial [Janthinobacterium sp. FT14W]|uniref:condensation domain-containing protein n=1 Tax=Janthinobacterium sp. FT14W TaxID=2654253 RepID=UPI00138134DF
QERLWFLDQLEPGGASYNCPGAVTLQGQFDIDLLEAAFRQVIARHETLRTVFPAKEGRARQSIMETLDFRLERHDLGAYEDSAARALQLCQAEAVKPFDLAAGPLIRAMVITLASDTRILMLNMHHIVSDGWSIGVLVRELGLIMDAQRRGEAARLPVLPIQYLDYSVWQRKRLEE